MMQTGIVIKFRRQLANGWACDVSRGWCYPSREIWSISGRSDGLFQKVECPVVDLEGDQLPRLSGQPPHSTLQLILQQVARKRHQLHERPQHMQHVPSPHTPLGHGLAQKRLGLLLVTGVQLMVRIMIN